MMMRAQSPAEEAWSYAWDYTMGLLEDNGFSKNVYGSSSETLSADGLHLVGDSYQYIHFLAPVETCQSGEVEAVVCFKSFGNIGPNSGGFRLLLSNGTYGAQITAAGKKLIYIKSAYNSSEALCDLSADLDYTIRLEFGKSTNRIFLDGNLLLETTEFSSASCTGNRIFQQRGGETVLKSLKYKFD